jgi:mannose-6-phosphate isomerase-like protein (cupin superfamily)
VWVVDATLKQGARHLYKRRTFYIDEDSWQILAVDAYDKRDQLWRVSEGHAMTYYNVPSLWTALEVHTDLQAGRYLAIGLNSEFPAYEFDIERTLEYYTPAALRRAGKR